MNFQVYDSLRRTKRVFEPAEPGKVRMYHCGPTVYGEAHIGNFRSFLFADALRRWLELSGFEVTQVMNITDVGHLRDDDPEGGEDKLESLARKTSRDPWEIAAHYTDVFLGDVDLFRIRRAHHYPRATEHVPQMIAQIEQLIERDHAYVTDEGQVVYSVPSYADYGRLSGNTGDDLLPGARVEVGSDKHDPRDFYLWKKDPHHLMQWDSPWGRGFPGWHIECSAMGQHLLGTTLDIHTGGEDNVFPHHECEIAQAEGATGETFVNYWMHARFLQIDGGKMSKSLGNLYTVRQLAEMGHPPEAVRFALLRSHYRQVLNFTFAGLEEAAANVRKLRHFAEEMRDAAHGAEAGAAPEWLTRCVRRFDDAMNDDLNLSGALDGVFSLLHEARRHEAQGADAAAALAALQRFDQIFDVLRESPAADDAEFAAQVDALIERRAAARAAKDWAAADALRDELAALDVELLDGKDGKVTWRRTSSNANG
ncbi:MAG: cysteine--tRNA ligase [Planctomycetota bacterium]|nr:MAG: cysteine--tRNA ligase [Planctomycetota bacterium]